MGENNDHRADIRLKSGLVIELQHSPIETKQIRDRENFYGNMIWVFDARQWLERCSIFLPVQLKDRRWLKLSVFNGIMDYEHSVQLRKENILSKISALEKEISSLESAGINQTAISVDIIPFSDNELPEETKLFLIKRQLSENQEELEQIEKNAPQLTQYNFLKESIPARFFFLEWKKIKKTQFFCYSPVIWDIGSNTLLYFNADRPDFGDRNQCSKEALDLEALDVFQSPDFLKFEIEKFKKNKGRTVHIFEKQLFIEKLCTLDK